LSPPKSAEGEWQGGPAEASARWRRAGATIAKLSVDTFLHTSR
jgi:hypothetical protein